MIARWFWREWRSPSLLIVWLALSLAVACVLALGNISDRMEKGLSQQSREFMAGDRALRSSREVPQAWLEEAQKRGLKVGKQLTFATMTFAGDTPQLANVKAVDDIYPMYGDLQTNPPGLKPQAGSVLLAPRLMALLNLKTGDTIDVGDATLRIAGEVIQEPDSGFNPFQIAPRLMMNLADVDKTGAVQPGSRVTWRYKFGGSENQLDGYEKWLLPQLKPEQRWYGLEQDEGALGRSIERSQQFLLLSALLTLLLAGGAGVGGRGGHSPELSGSTIYYRDIAFPLKNLPILKLTGEEERGDAAALAQCIRDKLGWFADEGGLSPLALALRGEGNPSYARVDELARGIAGGLEPLRAQGIAPVVLVEADQAKVLGQAMAQRVEGPLLCLDSVGVDNGDYIDIGAPVAGGAVLPVVIKTLVFNKS